MSATVQLRARRSVRWQALSLPARAIVLELVAEMRRTGTTEIALGRRGLEAVARFLGCPWTEVEEPLLEALESGKLIYEHERCVIADGDPSPLEQIAPSLPLSAPPAVHVPTTKAEAGDDGRLSTPTVDDGREVSARSAGGGLSASPSSPVVEAASASAEPSKGALRARAWRLRKKLEAKAVASAQLGFAYAYAANAYGGAEPCFSERTPAYANAPSLSLISSSSKKSERARLELDPANMPANWAEHSRTLRPDLAAEHIARSWRRFALAKSGKFRSLQEAEGRWETWLEAERVRVDAPAAVSEAPTTKRAPAAKDVAQPTPSAAATAQWQRQQERDAMASRTMPITAKLAMARGPLEALQAVGASA